MDKKGKSILFISLIILFIITLGIYFVMSISWVPTAPIISGLRTMGTNSSPIAFNISSQWYLISGAAAGRFKGYAWNGTGWKKNITINSSTPDIGSYSTPTVFYKDSKLHLIAGESLGRFKAFTWNGTGWKKNDTTNKSLPDIGSYSTPTVFYLNSRWHLISGNQVGKFNGFTWNGTGWKKNATINSSLPDIGSRSSPTVFYKDSRTHLISGKSLGTFNGFTWNGTGWKKNATINASLPYIGSGSMPTVFYMNSKWYLISGQSTGVFYGYQWDSSPPKITIRSPTNKSYSITTVLLNVTATDDGTLSTCRYSFNGGVKNYSLTNVTKNTWNATNSTMTQGHKTVTFFCNDTADNINSTTRQFTVDSVAPVVTITSPLNDSNSTDTSLDVKYTYTETNCVNVTWNDNNGANTTLASCGNNITTPTWSLGYHAITIFIRDWANNLGKKIVSFFIIQENTIPRLSNNINRSLEKGKTIAELELKNILFIRLISNNADLTYGESIFEIYNPSNQLNLTEELPFGFVRSKGGNITSYEVYVNSTEIYQEPIYEGENITGYNNLSREVYVIPGVLNEGIYKVKLVAHWKAILGEQSTDWVPSINFKQSKYVGLGYDLNITKREWAWWNSSWAKKKNISNLTGTYTRINVTYDSDMQADFDDIRFANSSENAQLSFYLESKTNSNSAVYTIKTNGASSIYMYYNNTAASGGSNSTFFGTKLNSSYSLDERTGTTAYDRTSKRNMTNNGVSINQVGKIGTSYNFLTGSAKWLYNANPPTLGTTSFSIFVWAKTTNTGTRMEAVQYGTTGSTSNQELYLFKGTTNYLEFDLRNTAGPNGNVTINDGNWHFLGVTNNAGTIQLYVDGYKSGASTSMSPNIQAGEFYIGTAEGYTTRIWNGTIDEVMIWNRAISASEILAWNKSKDTKEVFGSEESSGDATFPKITIRSPTNKSYATTTVLFNVTATDNVEMSDCVYSFTSGTKNYTMANGTATVWNATNSTMAQGHKTVTFYCNDSSDNTNSTTRQFTVDNVKPKISMVSPTNNTNSSDTGLDIKYKYTETNCRNVTWADGTGANTTLASCGTNITTQTWGVGKHNVTINMRDWSNQLNQTFVSFRIDNLKPKITIRSPTNKSYSTTTVLFNVTATDTLTLSTCTYSFNGGTKNYSLTRSGTSTSWNATNSTMTQGHKTVTFFCNDTADNINSTTRQFTIDSVKPKIQVVSPTNDSNSTDTGLDVKYTYTETNCRNVTWADGTGANTTLANCGTNITTVTWGLGNHNITINMRDWSNNLNQTFVSFLILSTDSTEPNVTINSPLNQSYATQTIGFNITATDDNAVSSCWYNIDGRGNITMTQPSLSSWTNGSDGFSVTAAGLSSPNGLFMNTTDFWITDNGDDFVYHFNLAGVNQSNGFSTHGLSEFATNPLGITSNVTNDAVTDFWIDNLVVTNYFVYHSGITGTNKTGAFNLSKIGASSFEMITTNGTDFWIIDSGDDFIYHTNKAGTNQSDGFSISGIGCAFGSALAYDFTDNTLWVGDYQDHFMYHFSKSGTNLSDGFSTTPFGIGYPSDAVFDVSDNSMWILDWEDKFVYHLSPPGGTSNKWGAINSSMTEGSHTANYFCNDSSNNINNTESVTFFIDSIKPKISMVSPSNNTNSSDTGLDIKYKYTETNCQNVTWSDGGGANTTLASCGTNITTPTWGVGKHNITINMRDIANNLNQTFVSFRINTDKPKIIIRSPTNKSYTTTTVLFNVTVTDGITLSTCRYSFTGGTKNYSLTRLGTTTTWNATNSTMAQGHKTVTFFCNDTADNINSTSVQFTVDNIAPIIDSPDAQSLTFGDQPLSEDFNATDTTSGVSVWTINWTTKFSINSGTGVLTNSSKVGVGNYYINVSVNDTAGNKNSTIYNVNITQATSSVNLTMNSTDGNISIEDGSTIDLNCSSITGDSTGYLALFKNGTLINNGTTPIYNSTTFNSIGLENITCIYQNTQNYSISYETWWVNVSQTDDNPPNVTINSPTNKSYNTATILFNITATDDGTLSTCRYSFTGGAKNYSLTNVTKNTWNATNSSMTQGSHTVTFFCNDTADNINGTETKTFFIDSIYPKISMVSPANGTNSSNTSLDVKYKYTETNCANVTWNDNSGANTTLASCGTNITTPTWTEGKHNITIFIRDIASNLNKTYVSFKIDTVKPKISMVSPSNNSYTATNTIDVKYKYTELNCRNVTWADGGGANTTLASCGTNITTPTWGEGKHNLTINMRDWSNNLNQTFVTFTIDTVKPKISMVSPTNNTNTTDTGLDVKYKYTELNCQNVTWADGTGANTTLAACGTNVTTPTWAEGKHNLTINIRDKANNLNQTFVSFSIDNTHPHIQVVDPVDYYNTTLFDLTVNYTYSDTNVDSCWWTDDEGTTNTSTGSCGTNLSGPWVQGLNNVTIYINDTVGNENSSTIHFTVDYTGPILTSPPAQSLVYGDDPLYADFNATDTGLGVDSFSINWTANFTINSSTGILINSSKLPVGNFYINVSVNDTLGNLNSTIYNVNVSDTTSPKITVIPASVSITYGTNWVGVDFNSTDNMAISAYSVNDTKFTISSSGFLDSVSAVLKAGNYYINVSVNDTSGNLNSTIYNLNVTKVMPNGSNSGTSPINHGTAGDVQGTETNTGDADVNYTLYRNGTLVSNPDTSVLGAGIYTYIYNNTDGENYSANKSLDTFSLTVNQIASVVNLTLNGTDGNKSISQNGIIDLNCSIITGDSGAYIYLYRNKTLINNGTSPIGNTTTFSSIATENITCIYKNTQNHTASSETWWVIVSDTTTPKISLVYPTNTTYTAIQTELNYSYSDTNKDSCWYSTDGGATNITRTTCANVTGLNSGQGKSVWLVGINDTSGNKNYSKIQFFVDSIYPKLSIVTPSNNTNSSNNGLDVKYIYTETNCDSVWWNDGNGANTTLAQCSYNITAPTWGQGKHNITLFMNDTLGNTNKTYVSFRIDTLAPTFVNWANQTMYSDSSLYYDLNGSDSGVGLDSFSINWSSTFSINRTTGVLINSSALIIGEYYINISLNDTLGNTVSDILLINVTLSPDTIHPKFTGIPLDQEITYKNSFDSGEFTFTDERGLEGIHINWTTIFELSSSHIINKTKNIAVGNYYINVTINDTSGNENSTIYNVNVTKATSTMNINWTSPIVYGTATNTNGTESDVGNGDVNYTLYRENAPGSGVFIPVSNPDVTVLGAGMWDYRLVTSGGENYSSGNLTMGSLTVTQNVSAISLTLNGSSSNISISQNVSIDLNCSTLTGDNSAYLALYRNGTLINNGTTPVGNTTTFNSLGLENITCIYQNTQNYSISSKTYFVTISDNLYPQISIVSPTNGTNSIDTELNITYTYTETNCDSVWWSDNNGANTTLASCGTNITAPTWTEGRHNITLFINDTGNLLNRTYVSFRIDTTPPVFTNLRNFTQMANLTFSQSITATDSGAGIGSYSLNDTTIFSINNAGLITNVTNLTTITIYYLNISVNDTLGNLRSGIFFINITSNLSDMNAPNITLNSPANYSNLSSKYHIYFNFTATDETDVDTCQLWENTNGTWAKNTTWVNPTSGLMNFTKMNVTEGTFKWNIWCNDTLGYANFSKKNYTFTVDTTKPNMAISNTNNTAEPAGDLTVKINYTVTDTHLKSCYFTLRNSAGALHNYAENTSINCSATSRQITTLSYGSFHVQFWGKDYSGNIDDANLTFITITSGSSGGGGGGGGVSTEKAKFSINLVPHYYKGGVEVISSYSNLTYDSVSFDITGENTGGYDLETKILDAQPTVLRKAFVNTSKMLRIDEEKTLFTSSIISVTSFTNNTTFFVEVYGKSGAGIVYANDSVILKFGQENEVQTFLMSIGNIIWEDNPSGGLGILVFVCIVLMVLSWKYRTLEHTVAKLKSTKASKKIYAWRDEDDERKRNFR